MKYRLLQPDEWDKLQEIVPLDFLPAPEGSLAAGALNDDEEVQGVLFLQIALHIEPLVLANPAVNFERLYDTLMESLTDRKGLKFYAFADREVVEKMAEHVGLERKPFTVFEGEVM